MRKVISISLLTVLFSCNQNVRKFEDSAAFSKPTIIQPKLVDSISYFQVDHINGFLPEFIGKYMFSDTLKISTQRVYDQNDMDDYIEDYLVNNSDSLRTDGFEILSDYLKDIVLKKYDNNHHYYYPVYIVNQTPNLKALIGKDSYVFGLQEAIDTNGFWRPIEGRGFDFCGRGYFGLKLYSGEFAVILFPKYQGEYKTKLRVRIKNGDNIYVSTPFEGTINEDQFYLESDSYLYKELAENKASAIEYLFYGARPVGADDQNFGGLHATYRFGR